MVASFTSVRSAVTGVGIIRAYREVSFPLKTRREKEVKIKKKQTFNIKISHSDYASD